jgi:hypothetical protein
MASGSRWAASPERAPAEAVYRRKEEEKDTLDAGAVSLQN